MSSLVTITSNLRGSPRRETRNGRDYLVAPIRLLVTGVLNGSKGALFYPSDEISRNYETWHGIPITVNHPSLNGEYVAASHPGVLDRQGVGTLMNPTLASHTHNRQRLTAEGWFDVDATRRIDSRVLNALEAGRPLEISTGLFTDNEEAPGVYNGRHYAFIARNYKPDHLAVLPDQVGACSTNDGCGINVNTSTVQNLGLDEDESVAPVPRESPDGIAGINDPTSQQPSLLERFVAWLVGRHPSPGPIAASIRNAQPSSDADVSGDKACKIVKDGEVRGHPLSDAQRGLFGAICGQSRTDNDDDDSIPTGNLWSDAAREASIAARQAKAHAAGTPQSSQANRALDATRKANREGTERAHLEAASAHRALSGVHRGIASAYGVKTDMPGFHREIGAAHTLTADAHEKAAAHHESVVSRMRAGRVANTFAIHTDGTTDNAATSVLGGTTLRADDFGYVPDPQKPSTWKLRLDSADHVGGAIAAIGKGFRGQKAQIPAEAMPGVRAKIRRAWRKFHGKDEKLPAILTNKQTGELVANSNSEPVLPSREGMLTILTTNCACQADIPLLNMLSDDTLKQIFNAGAPSFDRTGKVKPGSQQAGGRGTRDEYRRNADDGDDDWDSELEERMEKKKGTRNAAGGGRTFDELLAQGDEETRNILTSARDAYTQIQHQLASQVVANVSDATRRKALYAEYFKKSPDELRRILSLMPQQVQNQAPAPHYFGASVPGPYDLAANTNKDDYLPLPTMNYAEMAKEQRNAENHK